MGVYRCNRCEKYFDSHEVNCQEDPHDYLSLVCEDCFMADYKLWSEGKGGNNENEHNRKK